MKKSNNKKETQPSDNRESIELLPKNEMKADQQVNIGNVAGNVFTGIVNTGNVTYNISVENLITAEEDERRNKKKKSCLERLKEIHVSFKILAVLLGIFITLSPFIPKIIDGTRVENTTATKFDAILVIPGGSEGGVDSSYLMIKDGSSQIPAKINAATNDYAEYAKCALVKGKLFIFGGSSDYRKIARLEDCGFEELSARLKKDRDASSAAISINGGSAALICFGYKNSRNSCEKFDGRSALPTFSATWSHSHGGLGIYQNQPVTVGNYFYPGHGKAETLSSTGWSALPDFPFAIWEHSLVGLENESLLLLGGQDASSYSQTGIWNLKNGRWRRIGELKKPAYRGSVLYSGQSIFFFAGDPSPPPIHRIDLDNKEEIESIEIIGNQPDDYAWPILLETSSDFCV